jgi:Uma2 family endonuclease
MPAGSWDVPIPPKPSMTEEEFVTWAFKEDVRAEWIDGEVITMSPSSLEHVELFGFLYFVLRGHVERHDLGKVLGSELLVRFENQKRQRLPDLLFISKLRCEILRRLHVEGPPDMIIEIVSPDSVARDWRDKYWEYESAGVREYWVIDLVAEHAELYVRSAAGEYERVAERDGWLVSTAITGFRLKTQWLWPATRPKAIDALRELEASTA